VLGTVAAADDDDAGGDVLETDSGIGDVPMLTTRPAGPEGGDAALFFESAKGHGNSGLRITDYGSRFADVVKDTNRF